MNLEMQQRAVAMLAALAVDLHGKAAGQPRRGRGDRGLAGRNMRLDV